MLKNYEFILLKTEREKVNFSENLGIFSSKVWKFVTPMTPLPNLFEHFAFRSWREVQLNYLYVKM